MAEAAHPKIVDPILAFVLRAAPSRGEQPIPLKSTRFDVWIKGGVAMVETLRRIRNDEGQSIEATMTFPMPIHATLFELRVRSGGRDLVGRAARRDAAREQYEDGLSRGKTAVLHEELLRGIHMLSVGHVPSGAEVEVLTRWAITLTSMNGKAGLRIPTSVGDVYGCPRMPDSDVLIHGSPPQAADLWVRCESGQVRLAGCLIGSNVSIVRLDAPIDLEVIDWEPRTLVGRAADGRAVRFNVEPNPEGEAALDLAALIDRSGSMDEPLTGVETSLTKHEAVVSALQGLEGKLRPGDTVSFWQFSDAVAHVGRTRITEGRNRASEGAVAGVLDHLLPPSGGTEIGHALNHVATTTLCRDILLITDGKSHELDVQALARTGRRFSVVLVGEDSLEANVGHLAAITGGNLFILGEGNPADVLQAAIGQLRQDAAPRRSVGLPIERCVDHRGGMRIEATWGAASGIPASDAFDRGVAALAASLAIPHLEPDAAEHLALDEGLVTHLTSLVIVDEDSAIESAVPATRKVALPTPRTARMARTLETATLRDLSTDAHFDASSRLLSPDSATKKPASAPQATLLRAPAPDLDPVLSALKRLKAPFTALGARVDWDRDPGRLQTGETSSLEPDVGELLRYCAEAQEIVEYAKAVGVAALVLVVVLLARSQSETNRSAKRIANSILRDQPPDELDRLTDMLNVRVQMRP